MTKIVLDKVLARKGNRMTTKTTMKKPLGNIS